MFCGLSRQSLRLDTSIGGHFNENDLAGERGGGAMNKTDLIDHVAAQTDMSKAAAGRAIDALIGGIKDALCDGGSVTLVGFGTFLVGKRSARAGRNPRTGATITIEGGKVAKFKPGKALKDALN